MSTSAAPCVAIVGSGIAGVAAAFAAARDGADVTVIAPSCGASTWMSGALDRTLDDSERATVALPLQRHVRDFLDAVGLWILSGTTARAATTAGVLRRTRGCQTQQLDLSDMSNARIAVPRAPRLDWDADALARAWSYDPWARGANIEFVAVDAPLLTSQSEIYCTDAELAQRMDQPERAQKLAHTIGGLSRDFSAVLLGPWLGIERDVRSVLASTVRVPVGETLTGLGGTAGLRFERAARRILPSPRVTWLRSTVTAIRQDHHQWQVVCNEFAEAVSRFDSLVVASGGLIGGGVVYRSVSPSDSAEPSFAAASPFGLSLAAPLRLLFDGRDAEPASSLFGLHAERFDWPRSLGGPWLSERVVAMHRDGCAVDNEGTPIPNLFVAGTIAHGRQVALMASIESGLSAGKQAAAFRVLRRKPA